MTLRIFIIVAFVGYNAVAQTKTITVVSAENNRPLEGVWVDSGKAAPMTTDVNGQIKLLQSDKAVLSYIGYTKRFFTVDTVTKPIVLYPEAYELKGVAIQSVKAKTHTVRVLPNEGSRSLVPKNYGTGAPLASNEEMAVFIPIKYAKPEAVVKKLYFRPTDYRVLNQGKYTDHKGAKYAPFKANLYYADAKSHEPLTPVFEQDFEVRLAEGEKFAIINLDENQQFSFPEEGLCIVVRSCSPEYYKQIGFESAPAFDSLDVGKKSKFWQFRKALYAEGDSGWKTEYIFASRNEIYRFDIEVEYSE